MTLSIGVAIDFAPVAGETYAARLDAVSPILEAVDRLGLTAVSAGESATLHPDDPMCFHAPNSLMMLAVVAERCAAPKLIAGALLLGGWATDRLLADLELMYGLTGERLTLTLGLGPAHLWTNRGVNAGSIAAAADAALAEVAARFPSRERWVGGAISRSARRAAIRGTGFAASTGYTLELIERQATAYREYGGTGPVSANRVCVIAESQSAARELAVLGVDPLLAAYARVGTTDPNATAHQRAETLGIVGTPAEAVAALTRYVDAGVTHVQLRVAPGRTPISAALETLEAFNTEVLPHFDPTGAKEKM